MNRRLAIFSILFLLLSSSLNIVSANEFNGKYYGYGDSIMEGNHVIKPYLYVFVPYMVSLYDPYNFSFRNTDGGGRTSKWGYENFHEHVINMSYYIIEAFGINDYKYDGLSGDESAQYKLDMYNISVAYDSESHYMPCINVLGSPSRWEPWYIQEERIKATEQLFKSYSIRFCPLYDALDSDRLNGRLDYWNSNSYNDEAHPNKFGNKYMADLLGMFVMGWDYNETYNPGFNDITLEVNYNQTIHIKKLSNWSYDDLIVKCIENGTLYDWVKNKDIRNNDTISIEGIKGFTYLIRETYNVSYFDEVFYVISNYPEEINIQINEEWTNDDVIVLNVDDDTTAISRFKDNKLISFYSLQDKIYNIRQTYNVTYNQTNDVIDVISKFNETIKVDKKPHWNIDDILIICNENNTRMDYNKTGYENIKYIVEYDGIKNFTYLIRETFNVNNIEEEDKIIVKSKYNETILVEKKTHWQWDKIEIIDQSSGETISWNKYVDENGTSYISFEGVKGITYMIHQKFDYTIIVIVIALVIIIILGYYIYNKKFKK